MNWGLSKWRADLPGGIGYLLLVLVTLSLAALGAFVHPAVPLAILIGFWFFYFAFRSPFVMLLSFIIFYLTRLVNFLPILQAIGAAKYISLGALATLLAAKLLNRELTIVRSPYNGWMLLLVAMILLSSPLGSNPSGSMETFTQEFSKILILFFLILNTVTTAKQLLIFQISLSLICVFWAGYAIFAQIIGHDPFTGAMLVEGTRAGAVGSFSDPNDLAMLILTTSPFLLIASIESKGGLRLLFSLLLLVSLGGILATQSRGGLLGLAAGFGVTVNRYVKNKVLLIMLLVVFMAGIMILSGISDRSVSSTDGLDNSAQGRLDAWYAGLRMVFRHPLTGVGFFQFPSNYLRYVVNPVQWQQMTAHNTFILVLAEIGIPGFVAFCAMVYLSFKSAFLMDRQVTTRPETLIDIMKVGALPCFVAFMVASIFLSAAWSGPMYIVFAYFAAALVIFNVKTNRDSSISGQATLKTHV